MNRITESLALMSKYTKRLLEIVVLIFVGYAFYHVLTHEEADKIESSAVFLMIALSLLIFVFESILQILHNHSIK